MVVLLMLSTLAAWLGMWVLGLVVLLLGLFIFPVVLLLLPVVFFITLLEQRTRQ